MRLFILKKIECNVELWKVMESYIRVIGDNKKKKKVTLKRYELDFGF